MAEVGNQDELRRAYATLLALREALAAESKERAKFHEKYVGQYHAALGRFETLGRDVEEFKIPTEELQPQVTIHDSIPEVRTQYSEERYVDRSMFFAKIDAALKYFKPWASALLEDEDEEEEEI